MDITTLAAANAYTDKKVAEGGGTGGGLPVVEIDLENDIIYKSGNENILSRSISNKLDAAKGMPIFVKLAVEGMTFAILFSVMMAGMNNNGVVQYQYSAEFDGDKYYIISDHPYGFGGGDDENAGYYWLLALPENF